MLQVLKATSSSREKKMEKRKGAKTHPCFVPEVTLKAADMSPPSITWASIPSWKERIMFTNLSGQPILDSIAQRPSLFTISNALVRSMKIRYRYLCCSMHFLEVVLVKKSYLWLIVPYENRTGFQEVCQ